MSEVEYRRQSCTHPRDLNQSRHVMNGQASPSLSLTLEVALMWVSGPQHEEPQSNVDRVPTRCGENKVTNAPERFKSLTAGDCFSSFTQTDAGTISPPSLPPSLPRTLLLHSSDGSEREKAPRREKAETRLSDEKSSRPGNS